MWLWCPLWHLVLYTRHMMGMYVAAVLIIIPHLAPSTLCSSSLNTSSFFSPQLLSPILILVSSFFPSLVLLHFPSHLSSSFFFCHINSVLIPFLSVVLSSLLFHLSYIILDFTLLSTVSLFFHSTDLPPCSDVT